jgi:Cu/Ag efflux protein CusF
MKAFVTLAAALAFAGASSLALAQHAGHSHHGGHHEHDAQPQAELVDGEVKKIDKEAGKITLRHGELKSLNMSAMTMVFRVKDPAMLEQVKVGDKVRFAAERANGAITVVQLQAAQ